MNHFHAHFRRHKRAGNGGVYITDDKNSVGRLLLQNRFKTAHDLSRLYRMGRGTHIEIDVWFRDAKGRKELVVHRAIVVLPRVEQTNIKRVRARLQGFHNRRNFH